MATISKRGSSWQVRVYDRGGKRITKSFPLKAQAVAWGNQQEQLLNQKTLAGASKTLRDAFDKYAEEESPKKEGERWEVVRLKKLAKTMDFADSPIAHVTAAQLASWRDAQTTSPGTVRREMNLLTSVFTVAVNEWGWIAENPLKSVRKPPSPRPRQTIFTDAQVAAICDKLTTPKELEVKTVFLLALETAMRASEMLSLSWDQVDLDKAVAHLEKTKNGDTRDVPLSTKAVALLRALPGRAGPLFTVSAEVRDTYFRKARKAAGITGLTFHDSRATALTRLSKLVDVLTLARISGHRDIKSLMIYYRESAEDIAKRLG